MQNNTSYEENDSSAENQNPAEDHQEVSVNTEPSSSQNPLRPQNVDSRGRQTETEAICVAKCRLKLISSSGHRRSTGPLSTGKSKFINRKSGKAQLICALSRPLGAHPKCPMDKPALFPNCGCRACEASTSYGKYLTVQAKAGTH
ncbi:hypothetical protein TNCV_4992761 [Trichonephila clavipes]|nr:hypothetical protein TNCV_4992761 [Trichonephila clavipes]